MIISTILVIMEKLGLGHKDVVKYQSPSYWWIEWKLWVGVSCDKNHFIALHRNVINELTLKISLQITNKIMCNSHELTFDIISNIIFY